MPARGTYDPRLLARARSGQLTRSNTRPGTAERRAVDRVTYLRRREARPELTARQALGVEPVPTIRRISPDVVERTASGLGTAADRRAIAEWRQSSGYPSWLPTDPADLDDQTAAILAALPKSPTQRDAAGRRNGWRNVDLQTLPGGQVRVTVTPIRGRPFTFLLPDSDSARQLLGILSRAQYPGLSVDVVSFQTPQMGLRADRDRARRRAGRRRAA